MIIRFLFKDSQVLCYKKFVCGYQLHTNKQIISIFYETRNSNTFGWNGRLEEDDRCGKMLHCFSHFMFPIFRLLASNGKFGRFFVSNGKSIGLSFTADKNTFIYMYCYSTLFLGRWLGKPRPFCQPPSLTWLNIMSFFLTFFSENFKNKRITCRIVTPALPPVELPPHEIPPVE